MTRYCPNCDAQVTPTADGVECRFCHIEWTEGTERMCPTRPLGAATRIAAWERAAKAAGVEP